MEEQSVFSVFAGRYRYEPVDNRGQSWSTLAQLVYDLQTERLGILKRVEVRSERAVRRLENEVEALRALKGFGVPEVYDTGEAEYDSINYAYIVLEYIDALQLEKIMASLTASERIEILRQFFRLLATAHQQGIVNGDIDLAYLYWNRDKKQLSVVGWEHASLNVDPHQTIGFADDLARSAGIIFALVTRSGHPLPIKSFALPDETDLVPELPKLPIEFRNICMWAPRTHPNSPPYHTALELFEASQRWDGTVYGRKPSEAPSQTPKQKTQVSPTLVGTGIIALFLCFAFLAVYNILGSIFAVANFAISERSASVGYVHATAIPNAVFLPTALSTEIPTLAVELTSTPANALVPVISPSPGIYTEPILIFDKNSSSDKCWKTETNLTSNLWRSEGFTRRPDGYWRFGIERDRTADQFIASDFKPCLGTAQVAAMALNVWVLKLELERQSPVNPASLEPGKEFGFFIEGGDGGKREYTIWVDKDEALHLRVRENNNITFDEIVSIVNQENLKVEEIYPRLYAKFPIQVFFEINNNGLDILYLQEGPFQLPVEANELSPGPMVRMDSIVRPTFGDISKFGLVGYGGETQTVIWPLVFYGK